MSNTFVPTRYLSYSYADDGALILYNSLTGAIGAISTEQAQLARESLHRSARHLAPLQGVLQDLQEGGFLIPEGTNERAIADSQFLNRYSDDSLHLIILPTEQCNFRCTYCYESFLRGEMAASVRSGIKNYVADQKKLENLSISWFGGEPLLAKNVVIELSHFFHQYSLEHEIQYIAAATTNGFYLTPEVAEQIIPLGVRGFQITLDGTQEEHDQRRVLQGGGGTFHTIMENLRYLKNTDYELEVTIRHNYDPKNAQKFDEFVDMLKQEFGDDPRFSVFFFPIGKLGGGNDSDLAVCEDKSLIDVWLQGRQKALGAGLRNSMQVDRLQPNGSMCYAANPRSFVVGSNGNLYKCTVELDYHERNIVGHLYEDGRMDLDWRKMALWCETHGMEKGKKCYNCFFSPACHGAACPKDWMDEMECVCPAEKVTIRKLLPVLHKASLMGLDASSDTVVQCMK